MTHRSLLICAAAALGSTASAQVLMIPDSSADKISLYSAVDGSLVNADFILDSGGVLYDFSTPKDAIQVGNEIWVFDQLSDQIIRFDTSGAHVATILPATGMVDNMRGGCFANNTIYVSNDGSANGATADSVTMFDTAGTRLGAVSIAAQNTSPFDVTEYNGELLVSEFTSTNETSRYDYSVGYLGLFHASNGSSGIDSAEQISVASNGDVLIAGFSSPIGIYRYDSTGAQIAYYATGTSGCRGVYELQNGLILFTDGAGVKTYDPATAAIVTITAGSGFQYINELSTCDGSVADTCEPSAPDVTDGCTPDVDWTGTPDVTQCNTVGASDFVVTFNAMAENKNCNVVIGKGAPVSSPWSTESTRCFPTPYSRTGFQDTGGTGAGCTGSVSLDVENYLQGGNPLLTPVVAGDQFVVQAWYRDPNSSKTTQMTDAATFTVCP
jgi:hypothetical protein